MASRKDLLALGWLVALMMPGVVWSGDLPDTPSANRLTGIELTPIAGGTAILLRTSQSPVYTVFKLKDPDRLVVDFQRTELKGWEAPKGLADSRLERLATAQYQQGDQPVTRIILNLKKDVLFDAKSTDGILRVTLWDKTSPAAQLAHDANPTAPKLLADAPVNDAASAPSASGTVSSPASPPPPSAVTETAGRDVKIVASVGNRDQARATLIQKVTSGKKGRVSIATSRPVDAYEVIELSDPARIVVDIFAGSMKAKTAEQPSRGPYLNRIRWARHGDKVRVVLDLKPDKVGVTYQLEKKGKELAVVFSEAAPSPVESPKPADDILTQARAENLGVEKPSPAAVPSAAPAVVNGPAPKASEGPRVEPSLPPTPKADKADKAKDAEVASIPSAMLKDITFRQEPKLARVVLDLEGAENPRLVHTDERSAVVEIDHCQLPAMLERTLDTSEFGSAVRSLSAYRTGPGQRVRIVTVTSERLTSRFERQDGKLHWVFDAPVRTEEVSQKEPAPAEAEEGSGYTYVPDEVAGYSVRKPDLEAGTPGGSGSGRRYHGRRISLDFKDADIHNILRLIAEVSKLNIITSEDVKGKITITMRNVPWDQALDVILKTKRLGKVQQDNILRIAPAEELAKEQELLQKTREANVKLEPLRVRIIPVNYGDASEIEKQVKDLLTDRGSVTIDRRTNVLIVKDVMENLIKAEGLVRSLDSETPQVLIESRVVEANSSFKRDVGVQWGGDLNFSDRTGNPTGLPFPNNIRVQGGADDTKTNQATSGTNNPGMFAINLPGAVSAGSGGALGFIFGSASGAALLNLRLSALENRGVVKIISAPKVTTLDNRKAMISQGVSIPISVVSAAGVNTVFIEARLQLEVTPHITQDGSVLLYIKITKNEPDFSRTGANGDPTILRKEAETQVMVKDGDTTVIGGILTRKTSDTITGVPVLSRIPILGWFFRNTKRDDERTELLIFITPRIVNRLQSTTAAR